MPNQFISPGAFPCIPEIPRTAVAALLAYFVIGLITGASYARMTPQQKTTWATLFPVLWLASQVTVRVVSTVLVVTGYSYCWHYTNTHYGRQDWTAVTFQAAIIFIVYAAGALFIFTLLAAVKTGIERIVEGGPK